MNNPNEMHSDDRPLTWRMALVYLLVLLALAPGAAAIGWLLGT